MYKTLATCAVVMATFQSGAEAHGAMTVPKPNSEINNSPSGTIDGPSALTVPAGMSFGYGPDQNTEAFHKAFAAQTKYKTIRDLVYANFKGDGGATKECGRSAMTGTPQPLPDFVEYGGNGFDASHEGPCEVWCDDKRVFYEANCSKKYTTKPAKLPYDKAACAGAKRLQSIWLALHVPAWQAYISCASISGGGASSGGNGGNSGGNTPATTPAPAAGGDDEYPEPAPAPANPNPAPAPKPANPKPAPAPTTKPSSGKCTPKRFRRD